MAEIKFKQAPGPLNQYGNQMLSNLLLSGNINWLDKKCPFILYLQK